MKLHNMKGKAKIVNGPGFINMLSEQLIQA